MNLEHNPCRESSGKDSGMVGEKSTSACSVLLVLEAAADGIIGYPDSWLLLICLKWKIPFIISSFFIIIIFLL